MLNNPSTYREYLPCAALKPYVQRYWTRIAVAGEETQRAHRVLPDGCIDIVFNFGGPWVNPAGNGHGSRAERSSVVGTMTCPLIVEQADRAQFLGVRFRPGKARAFLNMFAGDITNQHLALVDIWGRNAKRLEERLAEAPSIPHRLTLLEDELLQRLQPLATEDPYVDAAVSLVLRQQGRIAVSAISSFVGISRQHLARKFEQQVGISPKFFARVVRFQSLVEHSSRSRPTDWASTAVELGYYDQAHMIADFREFAGITPVAFHT